MNPSLGVSGPLFLALYGTGLIVAVGYALLLRRQVRRPPLPEPTRQLDVAELAFLAGGPQRVAETAVAQLVASGKVRTSRFGVLTTAATRGDDPVQDSVLREIGAAPRAAGTVLHKVSAGSAVSAIGDRLVGQRLLLAPSTASAVRRRASVGLHLVGAVGLVRLAIGMQQGRPVGSLTMLLFLTVALVIVLRGRPLPARTVHGDLVVASIRRDGLREPNTWMHPALAAAGVGGLVALGGLAAIPDEAVRSALATQATSGVSSGGSCGGCSSWSYSETGGYTSSDSSSSGGDSGGGGGSGCGGGGCGGCGGGGG